MPNELVKFKNRNEILTFDEIVFLSKMFVHYGVEKIRLTGGEPLLRDGIEKLCRELKAIPNLKTLAITTNGTMLNEKIFLFKNSIDSLNISLDTLQEDKFIFLTQRTSFQNVMRGIELAMKLNFKSLKINTVVMRNFNDDEIVDFVEFAKENDLHIRFIEYMPFRGNNWEDEKFISYKEMKEKIEEKFELVPILKKNTIEKEFHIKNSNGKIGFITSMSEHFCSTCSRLRITSDGKFRNCLFAQNEIDLKKMLRTNESQEKIIFEIQKNIFSKWEKHPDSYELIENSNRSMIAIGG